MRFLFWNLNHHDIPGFVHTLAREHDVDILILAECVTKTAKFLEELNSELPHYELAHGNCGAITCFTRFNADFLKPVFESNRISIRSLTLPGREPILLAAAHLPSKIGFSDDSQFIESFHLSRVIDEAETREGHARTILVGDLNMNPFEMGMVAARGGLNAAMYPGIVRRGNRTVQGEKCKFFYNPMWSHFGGRAGAPGTFFYESGEAVCYFWNMFDQVLLRPDLLKGFAHEHVRILTEVHGVSLLLNDGRPDKEMASDHLPVLLELDF